MEEEEGLELLQPQATSSMVQRVGLLILLIATLIICVVAVIAQFAK